jgi:hypothetical protein
VARLNYAGKSDATLSADGAGTHDSPANVPADAVVVSDAHLLFNADFRRSGVDLIPSKDDRELVLHDYFKGEKRAALSSPDGTHLSGNIVNALTGHVENAQAGGVLEAAKIIGHVQTAIGSGTLTRACGIAVEAKVGDPVCQGDVIETAADGRIGLRFIDGTAFNLSPGARMVLHEFVCDSNGTPHSALFGVTRGTFDFVVGQVPETGCLRIDTPVGRIRGRARTGGIGTLTLTALIFAVLKEVQAAEFSSQRPLLDSLDDDKINPKDLQLNGVVELFMRDGRHYTLDDPSQTVVINGSGSISAVTNSPARMEELQRFQQEALATYALGTITGPTSIGGGGSSQPFSTPEEFQPINFQIDQSAPQNSGRATTQLVFDSPAAIVEPLVLLKPSSPLPPPVLTLAVITPMVGNSTVNTADTLNASGASAGFAIDGMTSGVENGQKVTVTIVNGSNVAVETFTATVADNAWSVNVSPAQAQALSDGGYTVMASVSNAAGTAAPPASQNLTVDQTPPAVTFDTVSFTGTGVQGDHITDNRQVTLSGTVSDNVTVSQVKVFNGSQLLGTATVDNVHHTWTLTTTLASGTYNHFNATAIDEVGNAANVATTQTVQVNDAPVLTPISPTLTTITEDQTTNVTDPGQTVSSFIGASISDVDAGAVKGIAITALTSTDGTWQYSIDGGTTWTAIGAVSNNVALLLDASDKIRFLPDGNNGGSDTITYRAWDETAGTHGTTADTSANGGATAFSTATDTAHLAVTSVNDAPVATITPTTYSATEQTSLSLKNDGLAVSDVDSLGGVEKVTLSVTEGTLMVTAGTSGATVSGSGSKSVTITGPLAQINALLNTDGTSTVSYIDNTYNPGPSATLTLSINDNGNTGSGGPLTGSDEATINITSAVSGATYKTFNGSTQNNLTEIDHGGSVRITLTFSGAVHFGGGNPTLSIADGDEVPPGSDDDVATYNASLSDPTHGVLVFTFTADSDGLTRDLAIIAVNGTIKDANDVNVNATPFIGVLSNHVHTDNTIVQEHLGLNEPAAPAGVAGEPINMALTDLSGGQSGPVTVTVAGAPSDWSLDQGTNLGGGIWAVRTSDPAALTIRTPANFVGAALLNVTENWTNADGSTGTASLKDNVEAYAAGSPIFALSGDDHLSGAGANDLFAFSRPIGDDIIYNFNTASDKIDLIGFNNVASFSDIQANLTDDVNGNAVIRFGIGETITLQGVHAASLNANDFVFDQVPVTTNAGSMSVSDGATLPLSGKINNTGTIELHSNGDETDLQIIAQGITLTGGGHVVLSDSAENVIVGTSANVTLTNVDNTIDGSGDLGGGQLTLVNDSHGIIAVTSAFNQLIIDTGAGSFTNHGVVLSNGAGGLEIKGALYSDGMLEACAGLLKVDGDVIGGGHAMIDGGNMEFAAASDAIVQFSGSIGGTLVLDDVSHFTGSVTGFAYGDTIDLSGIDPAKVSIGYSGSLEVHYGPGASDFFSLVGNYDPASFTISSDNKGGADIVWSHQTPVIETDQLSIAQNPDGTATISGLQVSDSDPAASTETFTVAATSDASGSSVTTPLAGSALLADLNTALNNGVTYNPGTISPATDKVALTVTDSFGATDTENFIFSGPAAGPNVALRGTSGNDVIFATGHQDILTGGGGADQFVFAPTSETAAVEHTITDFVAGLDKIDIRQFGNIGSLANLTEAQQGNDTLLTLDSHDSVLLKNVTAANLHASDFIISPHGS